MRPSVLCAGGLFLFMISSFMSLEEEIYNTEEEIFKNLHSEKKMCNNEHCNCENCTCDPCTCTAENKCECE